MVVVTFLVCAVALASPLVAAADDPAELNESFVQVEPGETAAIQLDGADPAEVWISGESDDGAELNVSVVVDGGEGNAATLLIDTGSTTSAESMVAANESAAIEAVENHGDELPPDQLHSGDYWLSVGDPSDPHDFGTLVIDDPKSNEETPSTPTAEDSTPTPELPDVGGSDRGHLVYDGEAISAEPVEDVEISGEVSSSVASGEEVRVRVRSVSGVLPGFLVTETATVSEYGTFSATFDLSMASPGDAFSVTVRDDDGRLAGAPGRMTECASCPADPPSPRQAALDDKINVVSGHTATADVEFAGAETVTVVVGSESERGYTSVSTFTVTDEADEERGAFLFDTDATATDWPTTYLTGDGWTVPAAERSSYESERRLPLDEGSYPVALYVDALDGSEELTSEEEIAELLADREPDANGTLRIHAPPTYEEYRAMEAAADRTAELTALLDERAGETEDTDGAASDGTFTGGSVFASDDVDSVVSVGAIGTGGLLSVLGIGLLLRTARV